MKKITILILIVCAATLVKGQGFPGTDSLRTYNSKYITTNPATAFTNNRLHTLLRGVIDWIDTARAGTGGGGAVGVDTLWTINDSTIRYRRNGSFYNHILRGVYDTRRKVDTAYALNDSTLQIKINGTNRNIILPGRHWDFQGVLNNGSVLTENENVVLADSLEFTSGAVVIETLRIRGITSSIDTNTYKPVAVGPNGATVKLPGWPGSGSSLTLNNVGTGYSWATTPNGSIKKFNPTYGLTADSSTSNTISLKVDTLSSNHIVTQSALNDTAAVLRAAIGSGSGVTTMAPIGSSPNANGASITGNTLTLQPTNGQYGGILNTDTQTVAGSKAHIALHNTIAGFAPKLQTQLMPSESITGMEFQNGRYQGFGFAGVTNTGKYFMIYSDAINHVGDSAKIKMSKSNDLGKTWDTTVIITGTGGGNHWVNMGAGGVTKTGRIVVFYQHFSKTTIGAADNVTDSLKVKYSDDEGATWSSGASISLGSTISDQLPHGPMIRIGGDSLLMSWYGVAAGGREVYVIKSGDDGATWSSSILVTNDYATQRDESSFTYVGGSTIIGLIRGETTTYKQVKSTDNGNTWTDQGNVSFGTSGTPPWTRAYTDINGQRVLVCYFKNSNLYSISGYASDIVSGPSGWNSTTLQQLAAAPAGNNYINIVHPDDSPYGWGYYYRETVALTATAIDFLKVPMDNYIPLPRVFTSPMGIGGTPETGVDFHIKKAIDAYFYLTGSGSKVFSFGEYPLALGDFTQMIRVSTGDFTINNHNKKIILSTNITSGTRNDFTINSSGGIGIGNTADAGVDLHIKKTGDAYQYITGGSGNVKVITFGEGALGLGDYSQMARDASNNFNITNHAHSILLTTDISSGNRPDLNINSNGRTLLGTSTDNGTGAKLQVNGDATVADEAYDATAWNGSLEVPTKNAVRDKLETMVSSLNSQTGAVTISAGTAISTSTLSGDITIAYNKTSSDVPHTLATYLTDVNNSGTSETDLYNTTVGANKLISNGQSIHFVGTVAENDITATTQIRIYFAGTEVANTGGISISGTGYLKISGEIIRTTSTTARASFKVEGNGLTTDYVNEYDLTSLDFTTTNVFKVTGTAGGGSGGSNDITAKSGKLTFQSN